MSTNTALQIHAPALAFKKAARQAVKLKMAVSGPSGAGKTIGALALARALAPSGQIAVIDTENGSASLYGDRYDFDVLDLAPPFTSKRYLDAMEAAAAAGYAVLVIDSLSHQWNGDGGILSRKEEMDKRPGSNSYTNWATFTKEHTNFLTAILQLPVHVIVTLRSKQDYVIEQNERGKSTPKKVGLAPVQREGLEYEFSTVFELQMDHRATTSKDRTGLFGDRIVDLSDPKIGRELAHWLATAAPATAPLAIVNMAVAPEPSPAPEPAPALASAEQLATITALSEHTAIDEPLAARIVAAVQKGTMTAARADEIRVGLEATIAKVTPLPLPTPAAAAPVADSAAIHELSQRLNRLMASDRVAQNAKQSVTDYLARTDLTPAALEQAIAQLEDAEIPF